MCVPTTSKEPNVLAGRCLFYISQNPSPLDYALLPTEDPLIETQILAPVFFKTFKPDHNDPVFNSAPRSDVVPHFCM